MSEHDAVSEAERVRRAGFDPFILGLVGIIDTPAGCAVREAVESVESVPLGQQGARRARLGRLRAERELGGREPMADDTFAALMEATGGIPVFPKMTARLVAESERQRGRA